MDVKEQIRVYLSFTKKERTGIILLLIIAGLIWCIPLFFQTDEIPEDVFHFSPVELDTIEKRLVHSIQKHEYEYSFSKEKRIVSFSQVKKKPEKLLLDINTADSSAFERLPGIGEKLSSRIVRYRERLGGFVSLDQLSEVYGIHDTLFRKLKEYLVLNRNAELKRLQINMADYKALRQHPYVSHVSAKILLAYRRVHDRIKDKEELMGVIGLDKKEMEKLLPYLAFD